jgi:hypothetical protein
MHVVQGGIPSFGRQPQSGLWTSLVSFLWFSLFLSALTFLWGVGAAAVRKYGAAGGLPQAGAAPGTAVSNNNIFAPREYNKVGGTQSNAGCLGGRQGCMCWCRSKASAGCNLAHPGHAASWPFLGHSAAAGWPGKQVAVVQSWAQCVFLTRPFGGACAGHRA